MLKLSECFTLLRHYQITTKVISQLWRSKVLINFPAMEQAPASLEEYLTPLLMNMRGIASMPQAHLYYAANELPFYHFYRRPGIALFKYYAWDMLTWHKDDETQQPFDPEYVTRGYNQLKPVFAEIVGAYARFGCTEIWHTNLLYNTLHQMRYIYQIGLMPDPSLITSLCDDLLAILEDIEHMAVVGYKDGHSNSPFLLYHNELAHTNNMALIHTPEMSQVFFAYDNPNVMYAKDQQLGEYTMTYFQRLISHADSLSLASKKARTAFFIQLREQVTAFQKSMATSA